LWKNLTLVKGKGFDSWRPVGTVLPAIKVYNTREVDELILVDITATLSNQDLDYHEIESLTAECFVPLTIGGGIKNIDQVKKLLRAGADKVCINTAAFERPELITEITNHFGSQCVIAGIDAQLNTNGDYECYSHSGTKPTGKLVKDWCKTLESLGAGEILLTSIPRDGTMQGYDLELIRQVASAVNIPVIASGGAGQYEHLLEAVHAGAAAVAAAAMFHFTEQTPRGAKLYLSGKGVAVRNANVRPI
jgi:cyclase